jgi:hypothetical protein
MNDSIKSEANSERWQRNSDGWVAMQEKSRKLKDEAERLDMHGEERRKFIDEQRKKSVYRSDH